MSKSSHARGRRCPTCGARMKCRKVEPRQGEKYGIPYKLRPYVCAACGATDEDIIFNHAAFDAREAQQDNFRRTAETQAAEWKRKLEDIQNSVNLRRARQEMERTLRSLQKTIGAIDQRLT